MCVCVCGRGQVTNYQFLNNDFSPWSYGQSSPYTLAIFLLWGKITKSTWKITFSCFIISSPLRNCYQPILAYCHPGGNKRLNAYITKCHTLSAHQTKTQYCILDTDGRHVYTVTANQNIGGMIWIVMFDFQTDTVMCKHQNTGLEGFNPRCEHNALHVVWSDNVFHLKKNTYNANHVLREPLLSSFSILKNMHHWFLGFTAANVHIPQRTETEDNKPHDALPSLNS